MSWLAEVRKLFRLPVDRPESVVRDVEAEAEFHLAMRADELRARGMSEAEAQAEARRRYGNLDEARAALVKVDRARLARRRRVEWLTDGWRDLRFAWRDLWHHRGVAALAIVVLAFGIGLATSVVSLYNRLALNPLPYPNADRLAQAWLITKQGEHSMRVTFEDDTGPLVASVPGVERVEGYWTRQVTVDFPSGPEAVASRSVTPALLTSLGAQLAYGRFLSADDTLPAAPLVTLLSHRTWRNRFAGRPDVVGQSLTIGRTTAVIVGVLRPGFDLTPLDGAARAELWLPLRRDPSSSRNGTVMLVTLREGARVRDVEAAIGQRYRASRDSSDQLLRSFETVLMTGDALVGSSTKRTFGLLLAAVALVLATACANVAALLLGRAIGRFQEFGVRSALGAGRGRVIRQLAAESSVLGLLGSAGGIAVTAGVLALARIFRPESLLTIDEVRLDGTSMLIAAGIALVTVFGFGLAPTWAISRADLAAVLVGRSRRSWDGRAASRLRAALVVGQIGLTTMLLLGAALLTKSFLRERSLPLGYDAPGLATVQFTAPEEDFATAELRQQIATTALERVRQVPGVRLASLGASTMEDYGVAFGEFLPEDRPLPATEATSIMPLRWVGLEFFTVTGLPLVLGRPATRDTASREIVIDLATAKRVWGTANVIGKRVRLSRQAPDWMTIVGVAGDVRSLKSGWEGVPIIYEAMPPGEGSVALVARLADERKLGEVTRAIRATHPAIRITSATTALESLDGELAGTRFTMAIVAWFATSALVLAMVGLYGVIAFTVRQRQFEFGIRLALGASPAGVTRMVFAEGLGRVAAGVVLGWLGSLGLAGFLGGLLYQMSPWDPGLFVSTAAGLVAVAAFAIWRPARRASQVDPLEAVRAE